MIGQKVGKWLIVAEGISGVNDDIVGIAYDGDTTYYTVYARTGRPNGPFRDVTTILTTGSFAKAMDQFAYSMRY